MGASCELREIRTEEERQMWRGSVHYAFALDQAYDEWLKQHERSASDEMEIKWGYFSDNTLLASASHIPYQAPVRGALLPMAGVSNVGTPPEYRRQGHAEDILRSLMKVLRERGMVLTCLWPFSRRFYRRYGWGNAAEYSTYALTMPDLRQVTRGYSGSRRFSRLSLDDVEAMAAVRRDYLADYDLAPIRPWDWWRCRVFWDWQQWAHVYGIWDDEGVLSGYLAYVVKDHGDWQRELRVTDIAYRDLAAYRGLLSFLQTHDSQVREMKISLFASDPLFDWLSGGKIHRQAGAMIRLLDVKSALESLAYPETIELTMNLEVLDDFVAAGGCFKLEVAEGKARVQSTDATPEARMPIGAFSQLLTGCRSLDALIRTGRVDIDVSNVRILNQLRTLFPPRQVGMMDHF